GPHGLCRLYEGLHRRPGGCERTVRRLESSIRRENSRSLSSIRFVRACLMPGRHRHPLSSLLIISWSLVTVGFLSLLPLLLLSQAARENAALRGTIHDSENKPVAGAGVYLQAKGETQPRNTHTDSQGSYSFRALRGGEYALWADKADCGEARVSSFVLGPEETKNVDLTLAPA